MSDRPKVLMCITAYNGEEFIERTLASAARIESETADVDVVVLDDASPAPGFSQRLADLCAKYDILYYGTPRNLGIPRNVSLGMLAAVELGYDYVVICNSDVIFPKAIIDRLLRISKQDKVGSVTAWSNNVSIYSIPNSDPDRLLADQEIVDFIDNALADHYQDAVMDVPAGISFCILIPTDVVREVGVMDPVFGRGYCEETDWTVRSMGAGYRIGLAPGTFVYHAGGGSNVEAGLLSSGESTVPANEAVIDLRYPLFRSQVTAFQSSGILEEAQTYGIVAILKAAGEKFGYAIDASWLPASETDENAVCCTVAPDGLDETVQLSWRGFTHTMDIDPMKIAETLREHFGGREPSAVNIRDRGRVGSALQQQFPDSTVRTGNYPARV